MYFMSNGNNFDFADNSPNCSIDGAIVPFTPMGDKPDLFDIQHNNVALFSGLNIVIRCSYLSIGLSINTLCGGILTAGGIPPLRNWLLSSTGNQVVKYNQWVMTYPIGGCWSNQGAKGNKKGSTANATSINNNFINHFTNDNGDNNANLFNILVQRRLIVNYSADCLAFRCLRLISALAAVIKKPAVLSPSIFNASISSKSSKGSLTDTCSDLLFFLPVAITGSPSYRWCSVYTKLFHEKTLTWCSPLNILVVFTFVSIGNRNSNAPKCANTIEAFNHNVMESYDMAMYKSTQTHPKFIWRFFSEYENQLIRCSSCAATEEEARSLIPFTYLIFTARISLGVSHA